MISLRQKKKAQAEIPTSSMADIAFLLLVFFLTTTTFANKKGLQMKLPPKGEEVKIASRNIMQILVSPGGKVLIEAEDGTLKETRIEDIRPEVERARVRTNDSVTVAIKVSRKAPYSAMIDVLDEVKQAGASRISLIPLTEAAGGGG